MSTTTAAVTLPESIVKAIREHNGKRRERTITVQQVESIVEQLMETTADGEFRQCDGGHVAASYNYKSWTTIALAARVDGKIYVGVSISPAHAASPGRAWHTLHNFGRGNMLAKLRNWTRQFGVVEIA